MSKNVVNRVTLAIGAALIGTVATASAATAFELRDLGNGYLQVGDEKPEGKCGAEKGKEGKCGEGKCGEGKCGAEKGKEGKCGEGKCGEGKCGAEKGKEGKCGEGKCGAANGQGKSCCGTT